MLFWLSLGLATALQSVSVRRDVGWHSYTFDYQRGAHQWFHFYSHGHTRLSVIKSFPTPQVTVDGQPWGKEEPCTPETGYLRYTGGRQAWCITGIIGPGDHSIHFRVGPEGWDCSAGKNYFYLESMCRARYRRYSNWSRVLAETEMFSCCAHYGNCPTGLATDLDPPY